MTASFTNEEFRKYLRGLEFTDMEGLTGFVRAYMEELRKYQDNPDQEVVNRHFIRYCLVMAEFGPVLLKFAEHMIEEKNELVKLRDKIFGQQVGQNVGQQQKR